MFTISIYLLTCPGKNWIPDVTKPTFFGKAKRKHALPLHTHTYSHTLSSIKKRQEVRFFSILYIFNRYMLMKLYSPSSSLHALHSSSPTGIIQDDQLLVASAFHFTTWLTDEIDHVLPPASVSLATEHLLSPGPRRVKNHRLSPARHEWQREKKNKQTWIMIIGWSGPALVQRWRHALLINCSGETFYNKHNNNLLTDGNHFP